MKNLKLIFRFMVLVAFTIGLISTKKTLITNAAEPAIEHRTEILKIGILPAKLSGDLSLQLWSENEGWVANRNHLWRTVDKAKTWNLLWPEIGRKKSEFSKFQFLSPQAGWLLEAGGRLHKTIDGGQSWKQINSTPPIDISKGFIESFVFLEGGEIGWLTGAETGAALKRLNLLLR